MATERIMLVANRMSGGKGIYGHPVAVIAIAPAKQRDQETQTSMMDLFDAVCFDTGELVRAIDEDREEYLPAEGIYVYEVDVHENDYKDPEGADYSHLEGGLLRRPSDKEALALAQGVCPWDDGKLI